MSPYLRELIEAGVVIAAILLYAWWDAGVVDRAVRKHLVQLRNEGQLPQGIEVDAPLRGDFRVRVPHMVELRHTIARSLLRSWYVWSPLVVILGVGLAAVLS